MSSRRSAFCTPVALPVSVVISQITTPHVLLVDHAACGWYTSGQGKCFVRDEQESSRSMTREPEHYQ